MLIIICVYKGLQCEGRKLPPKLVHVVCRGRMELLIDLSGCALINHGIVQFKNKAGRFINWSNMVLDERVEQFTSRLKSLQAGRTNACINRLTF